MLAKGVTYTVHLLTRADLDRQIVKSNWATITIPDIQLTIPPGRGQINTVEGIIRDTVRDLNISQPVRRVMDPETGKKIDELLEKLRASIDMEEEDEDDGGVGIDDDEKPVHHEPSNASSKEEKPFVPFSVIVDDPSGNSYFQFKGSQSDPQWNMRAYNRTFDQNVTLGLVARPEDISEEQPEGVPIVAADHKLSSVEEFESKRNKNAINRDDGTVVPDEIYSFPATCSSCGHQLETLMQQVNIPYFQVSFPLPIQLVANSFVRISSLCQAIATHVDTEITKSSLVARSPLRVKGLLWRLRTRRILVETCWRWAHLIVHCITAGNLNCTL